MTSSSSVILSGIAATIHLLRASVDLVKVASKVEASKEKELLEAKKDQKNKQENIDESNNRGSGKSVEKPRMSRYGLAASRSNMGQSMRMTSKYFLTFDRSQLLDENKKSDDVEQSNIEDVVLFDQSYKYVPAFALLVHFLCTLYFIILCVLSTVGTVDSLMYNEIPLGAAAVSSFIGVIMDIRDPQRVRFTAVQRVLYVFAAIVLVVSWIVSALLETRVEFFDGISLAVMSMNTLWALYEAKYLPFVDKNDGKKIRLTRKSLMIILKPYFWPDSTGDVGSAAGNRCRAMMTWVFVASSKVCNVAAPIFIGKATTALSRGEYDRCVHNVIFYCVIAFCGVLLKELQSLIYLKVAQAAFVQLAEISFRHLHGLSLDWHLRKKLGEVIRSMDRGILACDTLIKYLFLWLLPAMLESILVCIVFATYFNYFPLSISIFFFVFAYILWTIVVTLWRKKYRKAVAKSDNDWHDKCTDSLVNFETVKYFTAEDYEMKRFANSVEHFQMGSVKVQASLSFLNISQQVMLQFCLATSLILAAYGIRDRLNCCVDNGCETGNSECCSEISQSVCPGLELGDFVSVLSYTINLFIPLNFLGSVYNAIVMSVVDLTHLSELLAETADVVDTEDAQPLSKTNNIDPDIAVEFDNVVFHYPTQPDTKGLKGLSFKMKRGTTTAIVGPTGAGKTTVSRLLFRFYDVLGGAVKVNGQDVRTVTQKSLRDIVGVVPQATSMFNDTIGYNIRYGNRDATDEELKQAVKDAQIDKFIESLPEGLDTLVGDRGLKLSGGEKQRTAIARCLLKNPPIVLLDEATSALDTLTESSVQEALDRLGEDRTVLVIAHRLGTIRNADNIIVLDQGKVYEEGTHDELIALNGKYAEMWNMQLHARDSRGNLIEAA